MFAHRGLSDWQNLIAVERHPHTNLSLTETAFLEVNHVTCTAPFGRWFMGNFFWHLKQDMHGRPLSEGQIRCKAYAACRNVQRFRAAPWQGRL